MAGIVGVDPRPYTWWEMETMATGYAISEWDRMSHLLAMVASIFSKKVVRPQDFNPTYVPPAKTSAVIAHEVECHKAAFKKMQREREMADAGKRD